MSEVRIAARAAGGTDDGGARGLEARSRQSSREPLGIVAASGKPSGEPTVGLECPACGCRHFKVIDNEPKRRYIYRRRECRHCGRRVTTSERIIG